MTHFVRNTLRMKTMRNKATTAAEIAVLIAKYVYKQLIIQYLSHKVRRLEKKVQT